MMKLLLLNFLALICCVCVAKNLRGSDGFCPTFDPKKIKLVTFDVFAALMDLDCKQREFIISYLVVIMFVLFYAQHLWDVILLQSCPRCLLPRSNHCRSNGNPLIADMLALFLTRLWPDHSHSSGCFEQRCLPFCQAWKSPLRMRSSKRWLLAGGIWFLGKEQPKPWRRYFLLAIKLQRCRMGIKTRWSRPPRFSRMWSLHIISRPISRTQDLSRPTSPCTINCLESPGTRRKKYCMWRERTSTAGARAVRDCSLRWWALRLTQNSRCLASSWRTSARSPLY